MDSGIPPFRSDVVTVPSVARPTPTPVRVSFGDVLSQGANALASGAEAAMDVLPGGSLVAAAIRGGGASIGSGSTSPMMSGSMGTMGSMGLGGTMNQASNVATNAEGPTSTSVGGGVGSATSTTPSTGSLDSSLQQSQEMNLYFLQIQQEVNAQTQTFSTLSNVMKSESDTIKNAIGNLR
jgi:hypothetical protein